MTLTIASLHAAQPLRSASVKKATITYLCTAGVLQSLNIDYIKKSIGTMN